MLPTLKFAVIGTGIVGTVLAVLLEKAGMQCIGVNTRSRNSFERFRRYLLIEHWELDDLTAEADIIFITTQDQSIEEVAERLTQQKSIKPGQFWIHCSGSLQSNVMCKSPSLAVNYLSIHPLQAFANIDSALTQLAGTHFGIEGSNSLSEEMGRSIVLFLGGIPHPINPMNKTLYHAGAVVASNYLVSLVYLAVQLFEQAGIHKEEALESLLPLIVGSYQNIARVGLPCALTGPIARGDAEVVSKHLQNMPSGLKDTYKGLGRLALDLGKERKGMDGTTYSQGILEKLQHLLS